ncbi:MAG: serine hydrolase [Phycisphaerae bacterium]|nr:serine hydrolase [Phycisphaerae bacterium]
MTAVVAAVLGIASPCFSRKVRDGDSRVTVAEVGAGYCAKVLASAVFVAGRRPESVVSQELGFLPFVKYEVDREGQTVTAWLSSKCKKTAVYRAGLGVALSHDGDIEALKRQARPNLIPDLQHLAAERWPMGDGATGNPRPAGIDVPKLMAAVDRMFSEPNPFWMRRTRAVLVVYDGEIIAERYADGFGPGQRLPAWSMTKSVLHALYGIAVRQGKITVRDKAPVASWSKDGDPRSAITIDMMMRMSSGLAFRELDVLPPSDLVRMLFVSPDSAAYAARLPLAHPVDTEWAYASGTSNILSRVLREAYGDEAYYALPYQELFSKVGMRDSMIEADAAGTLVCSSFMFATARDFARFGLLYMNDGVWRGERILPEGWAEYGRTVTPTSAEGEYGAHWWLPSHQERARAKARGVPLPEDTFNASGFEGQKIVVIPSRRVVIVRLGLAYFSSYPIYDHVCDVLEALPVGLRGGRVKVR